ncbi:MAG TPA: CYCXC family (seleno)protein [Pyrinomonadaceae bacterium]
MKATLLLVLLAAVAAGAGCTARDERRAARAEEKPQPVASHRQPKQVAQQQPADDGHGHGQPDAVPAFQTDASELKSLKPVLSPALFTGRQKQGYEAAQAIPQTLAQLPCYCHCDKGFGHKSLQTCFVDDHAAHCAVCIDEALLAYKLEKVDKLKPEEIRERIVAKYTAEQQSGHEGHGH